MLYEARDQYLHQNRHCIKVGFGRQVLDDFLYILQRSSKRGVGEGRAAPASDPAKRDRVGLSICCQ